MRIDELGLTELDYEEVEINSDRWLNLTNLKNEVWKDIEEYEGLYQVSNYGRVKRLEHIRQYVGNNQTGKPFNVSYSVPQMILKLKLDKYVRIELTNMNGIATIHSVHRLVAKTFIPNQNNLLEVDHIDCVHTNNKLYNLQWVAQRENVKLSWERGRKKKTGSEHHASKKIAQYDLKGNLIGMYYGSGEASRATGVNDVSIRQCCKGGYGCKSRGGYIWKYI